MLGVRRVPGCIGPARAGGRSRRPHSTCPWPGGLGTLGRERDDPLRAGQRRLGVLRRRRSQGVEQGVCLGEPGPREREGGVERHRLLVVAERAAEQDRVDDREAVGDLLAFQVGIVGREIPGRLLLERLALARAERRAERLGHPRGDIGLDLEHVGDARRRTAPATGCGALPDETSTSSGLTCTRLAPPAPFSHRTVPVSR